MPTATGLRREHLRLERQNLVSDGQGGQKPGVPPYLLRGLVWAREEPLSSRETLQAKALTAVLLTAWTIPYRTDISVTDRFVLGLRVLHITSYEDVEGKHAELRVLASETQS